MGLTIHRKRSCCGHVAQVFIALVEGHGVNHHQCSRLGGRNLVGAFVGSCMLAKAPAARGSGKPRFIVVKQHCRGGCGADGGIGRACSTGLWPMALGSTVLCNPLLLPLIVFHLVAVCW
jgi:hypothetical protein